MQVVVLAGGVGSRLRPWTNDVPKPLLPMLDATLLERVVEGVPADLVDEVVVAGAGYLYFSLFVTIPVGRSLYRRSRFAGSPASLQNSGH